MKASIGVIFALILSLVLAACNPTPQSSADRAKATNIAAQEDVISRATAAVPVPRSSNFLARENLAEYMRRMDDPAKTWYVYEFGNTGAAIGYYVSSTYPQSVCTFMTPPEEVDYFGNSTGGYGAIATSAPALDGVYYGQTCASPTKFFFDISSGAMVLTDMQVRTSDQPLSVDAPRIVVVNDAADMPSSSETETSSD